jgi:hypothetical protein
VELVRERERRPRNGVVGRRVGQPGQCLTAWQRLRGGRTAPTRPSGPRRDAVVYRAAAAVPHTNRVSAIDGLRSQLRIMAVAAGATLDWTTLAVAGPMEMAGEGDRTRFEWRASVAVRGVSILDGLPDPDLIPPGAEVTSSAADETMPFRVDC